MADPLSIAAAVVGLVATAGKICSALTGFVTTVVDAPQSARDVLAAVSEMRPALDMVQELVATIAALPSGRKMLVRLDHVAVTFSHCVLTLVELESLVCPRSGPGSEGTGVMGRLKWVRTEQKVLKLLPKLESQKASLSLMISILRCQSEVEAAQSREKLTAAVEQLLQRDPDFTARMQQAEDSDAFPHQGTQSVRFFDSESVVDSSNRLSVLASPGTSRDSMSAPGSRRSWQATMAETRREFEAVLERSRVYARSAANGVDDAESVTSSHVRSHAWSMLSLNDISIVAVFRLPVTLEDINAFGLGLTMSEFFDDNYSRVKVPRTDEPKPARPNSPDSSPEEPGIPPWPPIREPAPLPWIRNPESIQTLKCVVVGDKICEKTRTIIAYTTGSDPKEYVPTVFDNYSASIKVEGRAYSLGIWDTSGQEDYDRLRPLSYPQTDVFLVFARVGMRSTFTSAEDRWIPEIQHHALGVPILLVGISLHGDRDDEDVLEQGRDYARMGRATVQRFGLVKYISCNIYTRQNLREVFDEAVWAVLRAQRLRSNERGKRDWGRRFLRRIGETEED